MLFSNKNNYNGSKEGETVHPAMIQKITLNYLYVLAKNSRNP